MYEQANRPFPDFPVDIPLPLYVCSVGKRGGESGSGRVPPLLSPFIGMTFCVRGSGVAYLFDRPFRMRENDVIFYYPHEEHRFLADSEESVIAWVNFDGPLAMSVFSSYRFPRSFPLEKGFPEEIYQELLGCLPKSDHDSVLHASTQLFLLFEYLAGEKKKSFLESGDVVERALRYIKANLSNSELNVNTLCDVLHLSRSTFRKRFAEAMHVTPGEYIRNQRIARARTLLAGTNLSIQEIGRECGFQEKTSFSRFFKACPNSMPPSEYRRVYNRTGLAPGEPPSPEAPRRKDPEISDRQNKE